MIHKGFDFSQMGGFPLNQQRLEYMQDAYKGLSSALAGLIGDNSIVSGCIVTGSNVSDGWVVIAGELLPFVGGASGTTVIVRETKTALTFKDATQKEVQFSRIASFGVGIGSVNWSDMKRVNSLSSVTKHIENKENPHGVTKKQVGLGNLPNAKTDDPTVSDSEVLASTKMVHDTIYDSRLVLESGIMNLPTNTSLHTVAFDFLVDPLAVSVFFTISSMNPTLLPDRRILSFQPNRIQKISVAPNPIKNNTLISVNYDNTEMNSILEYNLHYAIIKR